MELTVKTKFNIGDVVYVIDHYYELYARKEPRIITDIFICGNTKHIGVRYELTGNGDTDVIPEEWVFATYEECVKWCKDHN